MFIWLNSYWYYHKCQSKTWFSFSSHKCSKSVWIQQYSSMSVKLNERLSRSNQLPSSSSQCQHVWNQRWMMFSQLFLQLCRSQYWTRINIITVKSVWVLIPVWRKTFIWFHWRDTSWSQFTLWSIWKPVFWQWVISQYVEHVMRWNSEHDSDHCYHCSDHQQSTATWIRFTEFLRFIWWIWWIWWSHQQYTLKGFRNWSVLFKSTTSWRWRQHCWQR